MRINAHITIYNKYIEDRSEKYQRTQISDIVWENRKAANKIASGGNIKADSARIFIPFGRGENYLQPKEWQTLATKTGRWTLQGGDFVVKGLVTDDITSSFTITDLKKKYNDVLAISSVDTMDMGSANMQHWQVGAL